jgi:hypothetical protein
MSAPTPHSAAGLRPSRRRTCCHESSSLIWPVRTAPPLPPNTAPRGQHPGLRMAGEGEQDRAPLPRRVPACWPSRSSTAPRTTGEPSAANTLSLLIALLSPVTSAAAQVAGSSSATPSRASLAHTRRRIAAASSAPNAPRSHTMPRSANSARSCPLGITSPSAGGTGRRNRLFGRGPARSGGTMRDALAAASVRR